MTQTLIIGGDSVIGGALFKSLKSKSIPAIATSRRETIGYMPLNLAAHPVSWPELPDADVAYLCAAITKLDMCESEPDITGIINVGHMKVLAEQLQKKGTFVVFLSSNHVFDGSKPYPKTTDPTCPVNEYGRQKAAFEAWLAARNQPHAILRLTKVIATQMPVIAQWETALKKIEGIEVFNDLRFSPLPLSAVLTALQQIGESRREGILHLSGTRDISYIDIANRLAQRMGVSTGLIKSVSATTKGVLPNFLPQHGTLEMSAFEGIVMPDPEEVLGL